MKTILSMVTMATVAGVLAACSSASTLSSEALAEKTVQQSLALEGEACVIDDEELEHSCLHANFGPFRNVAGVATAADAPPDVSPEHTAYTISLPSAGCGHRGLVAYTPEETGDFAIFLDGRVGLQVLDGETRTPVECSSDLETEACPAFKRAYVAPLEAGKTYYFQFTSRSIDKVQMVIEEHTDHDHEDGDHDHEDGDHDHEAPDAG